MTEENDWDSQGLGTMREGEQLEGQAAEAV